MNHDFSAATALILSFSIGVAMVVGAIGLTHAEETAGDVTGDSKTDVAVANNHGFFIFRQR